MQYFTLLNYQFIYGMLRYICGGGILQKQKEFD